MSAQLNVNELLVGTLGIVNHATGAAIAATFANVSVSSSDTTIFTAALDTATGNIDVDGVAIGAGNLGVTADATYVDPVTTDTVTATKSLVVSVTVAPAATATDLTVTFGTPTPIVP